MIRCKHCLTWARDKCHLNGKRIASCPHQDKLQYLSVVQVPKVNSRKVKVLNTRDVNEALELHMKHRREVKEGNVPEKVQEAVTEKGHEAKGKEQPAIIDLMGEYQDFLAGENVPEHQREVKSEKHRAEVARVFKMFSACFQRNGGDVRKDSIDKVDDFAAGKFHTELEKSELSGRSYDKYMGHLKTFFNFLIKRRYADKNPFHFVRKEVKTEPVAITKEQVEKLLAAFKDPEMGRQESHKGKIRQMQRDWLPDITLLGLYTGRRLSELFHLKWENVKEEKGQPAWIEAIDLKATRMRHNPSARPKYNFVPITEQLHSLLVRLGLNQRKGSEYLIAPDDPAKRETLILQTSKSFSHYSKKLFGEEYPTFHALRKAYATELAKSVGPEMARLIMGWSNMKVMQNHYLDPKEIGKVAKDFSIFGGKEEEREKELAEMRENKKSVGVELER